MNFLVSVISVAMLVPPLDAWTKSPTGNLLEGYRGFGCGMLHRGNRSECWVVTEGDGVRPAELYQASYGVIHAELLTRYERHPLTASRGIKVWCKDLEPFMMRFRRCRVSKPLMYPDGGVSVNYHDKPLRLISGRLSEGRLEFAEESTKNAMSVKCTNFPDFWVREAPMCKIFNARVARTAGLAAREPMRRVYTYLADGTLVKVNRSTRNSIQVRCANISPFSVKPTLRAPRRPLNLLQ